MPYDHIPVMLHEVLHYLNCRPGGVYVDCTLGGGGHSRAILDRILPGGLLIGIDQDRDAIKNAREHLAPYASNVHLFHGNYIRISEALSQTGTNAVDGMLLDLGVSMHQLKNSGRGFSFNRDERLDMRMNTESETTAADLVNGLPESDLAAIFRTYGEERWARRIARRIVSVRSREKIRTSGELAELVCRTIPGKARHSQRIHPATRVFMSLRIATNKELERLEQFLDTAVGLLRSKGRLCILAYHSLEDRIVKGFIRLNKTGCHCPSELPCVCDGKASILSLTPKVNRPEEAEIERNPMARSARLRAVEKI